MGFFSWNCECCGESIKSPYECVPEWHNQCVAALKNGSLLIGDYDGYGRILDIDCNTIVEDLYEFDFTMYHKQCWIENSKPGYISQAQSAQDQGYFY